MTLGLKRGQRGSRGFRSISKCGSPKPDLAIYLQGFCVLAQSVAGAYLHMYSAKDMDATWFTVNGVGFAVVFDAPWYCRAIPSSDCDWMILFAVILGQYSGAFVSVVLESGWRMCMIARLCCMHRFRSLEYSRCVSCLRNQNHQPEPHRYSRYKISMTVVTASYFRVDLDFWISIDLSTK